MILTLASDSGIAVFLRAQPCNVLLLYLPPVLVRRFWGKFMRIFCLGRKPREGGVTVFFIPLLPPPLGDPVIGGPDQYTCPLLRLRLLFSIGANGGGRGILKNTLGISVLLRCYANKRNPKCWVLLSPPHTLEINITRYYRMSVLLTSDNHCYVNLIYQDLA
jgi:hypothetical protein